MTRRIKRRSFLKAAAGSGLAAAGGFATPAIAEERHEWRMVTTWIANFPGLGTGAKLLADLIERASEGRIRITVYGAGEIVPALEVIGAVSRGIVEMGHGASYYWKGKVPAMQYLTAVPFGLTAQEQNAWYQYGGGQEIADRLYAELGCKFFPCGNTGVQMGGWFNKEINSIEDFRGLKMRIPGLGGEVVRAAGGVPDDFALPDIMPALQSGRIDATEFVGPYNDLAAGFYKSAKYYYYPGWHEPATCLDGYVNLKIWQALPSDLKAIVTTANRAVNQLVLSEFVTRNNAALNVLIEEHGVELKRFSDEVLQALGALSSEVLQDLTAGDAPSREVFESLLRFRKDAMRWSTISEKTYLEARALPYPYGEIG
ncbi:MAG: TRAP transporter substrate-binding protein [Proteobacteria bacterium]|nr:TRAP transporter substrate-binding protein [Pseudomonadota bacterium]